MDSPTIKTPKMLLSKLLSFTCIMSLVVLSSCYYDKEEALYPSWPGSEICDTTSAPTYLVNIQPIIAKECSSCHSSSSPSAGLSLVSYENVTSAVNFNHLMDHITEQSGYSVMPQSGKMSDCKIALIQKWVINGMPD
jgi:hypothetical protein